MKKIVLFFLALGFTLQVSSQKCPLFYERVLKVISNERETGTYCFKRDTDSDSDAYHTKYSIYYANTNERKDKYYLHYYFYTVNNYISVSYSDLESGKIINNVINLDERCSIRMFKNNMANDTLINDTDIYSSLFTIPEISRPYVTLNQFQPAENTGIYLILDTLNKTRLSQHLLEVRAYYKWKDSINTAMENEKEKAVQHEKAISDIFSKMSNYKDSVIEAIKKEDTEIKTGGPVAEAGSELSRLFKNKLDPLFNACYSKTFPFENYDSEIEFIFSCDADGKIEPLKTKIRSINSLQLKWFEDAFREKLLPEIVLGVYGTLFMKRCNPNATNDFINTYKAVFFMLDPNAEEKNRFYKTQSQILNELEKYLSWNMSTPTKYTYTIKYRSTVKANEWTYKVNRKGVISITQKSSNEAISEDLKKLFIERIAGRKEGGYQVKICQVFINDLLKGMDMQIN